MRAENTIQVSREKAPASARIFAAAFVGFCLTAAALVGSFPLQLSLITIFLFAGVHNFFEFRYFIARMPRRWGKSKTFYAAGIGGVLLTLAYLAIYFFFDNWLTTRDVYFAFAVAHVLAEFPFLVEML